MDEFEVDRPREQHAEDPVTFAPGDDPIFVSLVTEHLQKGAATKRGISADDYVQMARAEWSCCHADQVYAIKMLVDPVVQPEIAAELPAEWANKDRPFCELIAAIDSHGNLAHAPPGYVPPSIPGVLLNHIPAGSPSGGVVPDPSQPANYLVAFLDVLGFEDLLRRLGLEELARRYDELLAVALAPNSESRPWSLGLAMVQGEPRPGLMWMPIHTAYFSDSLVMWVHYHPGHVAQFLDRCSRVFCQALVLGLPVRGAVAVGRATLDKRRGVYLGLPIVEAVRLEGGQNWIGVALGASWKDEALRIPVPPDRVFVYDPPLKDGAGKLFSGLVLDWPRVWRESRPDSAVDHLQKLCDGLPQTLKARYSSAITFWHHSVTHENWFMPTGARRLTPRDLASGKQPRRADMGPPRPDK